MGGLASKRRFSGQLTWWFGDFYTGTPSVMQNYRAGSSAIAARVRLLVDELARTKGTSGTP